MQENHTVNNWSSKNRKDNDVPRETDLKCTLAQEWNSLCTEMSGSKKILFTFSRELSKRPKKMKTSLS